MKKQKKSNLISFDSIGLAELFAFLFSLGYMQSVLTVANHVSTWTHDGTEHIVQGPAVPALAVGLLLLAFAYYKRKGKFTTLMIIALTILATSSIFWLSGLRTNFYY